MNKRKELVVSALKNGTVIDHIPEGNVLNVVRILNLENFEDQIYLGANLDSKKYGKKGLIKVSNKYFKSNEINKIALVAPTATLIEIKDFQITSKKQVSVPNKVDGFVKCINPNCVTNVEGIGTKFQVVDKKDVKLKCYYCEKVTAEKNIEFV
jgi:aspartate carbamoyltransferase regulatory subunit